MSRANNELKAQVKKHLMNQDLVQKEKEMMLVQLEEY